MSGVRGRYARRVRVAAAVMALAGAGVLAACGGGESARSDAAGRAHTAATTTVTTTAAAERKQGQKRKPTTIETTCRRARVAVYRFCDQIRVRGDRLIAAVRATIEVRQGSGWRVLTREPRGSLGGDNLGGEWAQVWVSPDGRTLLAEWAEECDTRYAFFVPAEGGVPRAVTGERDWKTSPLSWPRGWARDGRARVWVLPGGGCAHEARVEPGR